MNLERLKDLIEDAGDDDVVTLDAGAVRELIGAAEEASRLSLVLQETALRNAKRDALLTEAWGNLRSAMSLSGVDPAGAFINATVRDLVRDGMFIRAIKELRDENPGLRLADAKRIIDGLRS